MQLSDRIGRRMKLQDLHVLMTVVQAGSMRKAATLLNTSQPAISRSIAELENAIGVRLLDRNPQGVAPTAYGRALLDGGAAMFDELHQAVKNIEFLADPTAGDVRIGSGLHVAATFVSTVVDRLSRRYPRIVLHLFTNSTEALHRDLHERSVDLLIARRLGSMADERQDFEVLFDNSYVVVAGAQHPWARRRRIEPAELVNELWVLPPPESPPGSIAMDAFRASGLDCPRTAVFAVPPDVRMSLLFNRALSHDFFNVRTSISDKASGAQGLAGQAAVGQRRDRHRHPQEPYAQPGRAAIHRTRARSCQAAGETMMRYCVESRGRRRT